MTKRRCASLRKNEKKEMRKRESFEPKTPSPLWGKRSENDRPKTMASSLADTRFLSCWPLEDAKPSGHEECEPKISDSLNGTDFYWVLSGILSVSI